ERRESGRADEGIEHGAGAARDGALRAEHHHAGVRKVDDPHHAVDDGEAVRHGGVQPRGEERVEDDRDHFGIGAMGSPVFAVFGHTRSSFPPGLFCVTTKGSVASPVLLNLRTPPGRIESFSSSRASDARMASGFSEPAFWIAVKTARAVSYAG